MVKMSHQQKTTRCTVVKVGKMNGHSQMLPEYATIILVRFHQVECFEQFTKLFSYFFIQVNNVELMVFATAQEMAMHSMMRDNVYHGTNVQVTFTKTFVFIIFLLL